MTLYKYVPPERFDILEKRRILITQPGAFNDLFEFLYGVSVGPKDWRHNRLLHHTRYARSSELKRKEDLAELSNLTTPPDSYFEEHSAGADKASNRWAKALLVASDLVQILDRKVGVLSLTSRPDNLLMWSHYTDDHKGFAIGFDEKHAFFANNANQLSLPNGVQPVRYRKRRKRISYDAIDDLSILFEKSVDWQYEAEYRMLMPLNEGTFLRSSIRKPGYPFEEVPLPVFLFRFPAECIESIILGARFADIDRMRIERLCGSRQALRHVQVYQARPHPTAYRIDIL